jgi:ATP-binding cassette subfamily B multidrug efflux pump
MQKSRLEYTFSGLLLHQLKEFKVYYFFGIICLIFTHKIQVQLPFMAKDLADYIAKTGPEIKPALFFLCALGIILFRTSSRILFFYPARLLQKYLRLELLKNLENNTPQRFRHLNAGQLYQYLSGDIDQIRALIGFVGLQGANFIIALAVLFPKLVGFNPKLIVALTPMLISFIIFTIVVNKNKKYFKLTQDMQGEVQNLIIESYVGKRTIKNFHAEESFNKLFSELSLKELYYFYRSSLGLSVTLPLVTLGVGLSMLWGATIIRQEHLGASTLILFSGFIFLFMEPMSYLSWIGVVVSRSSASWTRLQDLNKTLTTEIEAEEKLRALNSHPESHRYHLPYWEKDFTLTVEADAWNVIIAKTGHGKSELLLKIAEILRLRGNQLSLVAQDPYIYNDTVERNIFLGRTESEEDKALAKKLLKILGLDYLESNLDTLLKMEVGENGKRLSGGQAKRLCLIRSLMSGAEFLIWDDPFSSVDLILEKEIIQELKKQSLMKNRTIILTSHRLSTVRNSDYVLFIDKEHGIIEEGKAENLLTSKSKTYEYFQKQMV